MHGLNFIALPLPYVSLNLSGHLDHSLKHALHVFLFSFLKTYDAILAIELRWFMTCICICILWCYSAYAAGFMPMYNYLVEIYSHSLILHLY